MATRIATISAHVTAQDRGFGATMNRVREEAKKTKAALDGASGQTGGGAEPPLQSLFGAQGLKDIASMSIKGLLPLVTAIGLVKEGMESFKKVLEEVGNARDRIKRTSLDADTLGLSYNEMQAVSVAAAHMGTNTELTSTAIGKMLKLLEEAADGSGEANEALSKLGLTVGSFKGKTTYEALLLVADGLDKIDNTSSRIFASSKLFGRGAGLTMIDVLAGGSEAMRKHAAEAKELGLELSNVEVEQVKAFKAMEEVKALRKQGTYDQLATNEFVERFDLGLKNAAKTAGKAKREVGSFISQAGGLFLKWKDAGFDWDLMNQLLEAEARITRNLNEAEAIRTQQGGNKPTAIDVITEAEAKKLKEHKALLDQWKAEHDQWLQDFYNSSFENFASQPGLGGGNAPVWMGMSLNDMKQAYEMRQKMAELDKAIQEGNERDLIAADQARREKEKDAARIADESRHRLAPLLVSGSAEAQRAGYLSQMQNKGFAVDTTASSQAARDKENLRLQREQTRILKQIEKNTTETSRVAVGV